jgi:hypothetical protein
MSALRSSYKANGGTLERPAALVTALKPLAHDLTANSIMPLGHVPYSA